jgi:uncharacterized protein YegL
MEATITYYRDMEAVLRIKSPQTEIRVPTHFVILLDLSDSMDTNNKLENVKRCSSLLLDFLQPQDRFSLITFADDAVIRLQNVEATPTNIVMIRDSISGLHTDGATNLSAAFATLLELIGTLPRDQTLKMGVMLLTDGHANQGVTDSTELQQMVRVINEKHPTLSLTAVAYGNDHNAELMKMTAEEFHTSYNIVNTMEDAAAALGDTLGAFVSTCAQNVRITCSELVRTYGPYKNQRGSITIGDMLANNEIVILMDAPRGGDMFIMTGVEVPSLAPFTLQIVPVDAPDGRNIDVDLLRLRYKCSEILQTLRVRFTGRDARTSRAIEVFAADMADPAFDGNPLAEMLRAEIPTMRAALLGQNMDAQLSQHSTYIGLGRGISTQANTTVASPFQNRTMRSITGSMRQASQTPNDPIQPDM